MDIGQGPNEPFNKFNRELAVVIRFFNVVRFHIGNDPDIAGVLSQGVARKLSGFGPFEIVLFGVFGRYSNGVQVKGIFIRFCEPEDCFVAARQSVGAV